MSFKLLSLSLIQSLNPKRIKKNPRIMPWLDVFALLAWGTLFLKYVVTGQIKLLIHPNYIGLVLATSIVFLLLAALRGLYIIRTNLNQDNRSEHITLFSPHFSSSLLLIIAILGLLIPPSILSSQAALQRGVTDTLPLTRFQPQSFRTSTKPEDRSLFDWVRTLNAYPEPDAYTGQKANVKGFIIHLPELPDNYILLARFVVTCCAVDAYPVGIPVQLEDSRVNYPQDRWLVVQGTMKTETLPVLSHNSEPGKEERQLVLVAKSVEEIPTPSDPYDY